MTMMKQTPSRFSIFWNTRLLLTFGSIGVAIAMATTVSAQDNLNDIPDPDPELERKSFIVAEGFEVNLFAADPRIAKPTQMNFDAQGRLWIASSKIYPHIQPGQKANDKILIIEDRDGDGVADKTTVFADGLLIPTGVLPGDGGAYVSNSTELLHLRDTDGDSRADRSRIVLSGFGAEDTHHILHTLRWGHDGMLYMNQSIYIHSHIETPYGVRRLGGGGIWQYRPETMRLEIFCRGFVNPWGHHFDHWGQSFATDGAYGEGINYVFPGAVYVTAPGAKRRLLGLNPGSPKHCGLEILSGRHLPPSWQGNMITNDFRGHRVCRFVVTEDGSGYASRQETELIKTKHVAFRPIDVKMGPDGAIYIADWYNPIIQHGEVDFRDQRRDHVHGRIWRVTAKGRPTLKTPQLIGASTPELLETLKAPESWNRLHAKLILKSRGAKNVVGPLQKWITGLDSADDNYDHHRLEALWLYQCLDRVEPHLLDSLLSSPDHRVRAAAMRVLSLWRHEIRETMDYLQAGVSDDHPRVRLESVRALAQIPSQQSAILAMQVLDRPMDRFLDFALWQTMRDLEPYWLGDTQQGRFTFHDDVDHLIYALRAVDSPEVVKPLLRLIQQDKLATNHLEDALSLVATLGGREELGTVLDSILLADESSRQTVLLDTLVETTRRRKIRPAGDLNRIRALFKSDDPALVAAVIRAAGAWKLEPFRDRLTAWATAKQQADAKVRNSAIESLALLGGNKSKITLSQIAQSSRSFDERKRAVSALASLDVKLSAKLGIVLLAELPKGEDPREIIAELMSRKKGPDALMKALRDQKIRPDIAKLTVRAVQQSASPSPPLIEALRAAGGLSEATWKLTPALLIELVAEVKSQGDPVRGESIFRREELQCAKCHAIGGSGGLVGPDLVSLGASAQVDYLIESLIEPNKKVKENFHSIIVQTDEGKIFTGIVVRQSDSELVLRDAEDRQIILSVDAIEDKRDGRSLMADGAVDTLTRAELVDLVRFLSELGKIGDFAISQERLVRRWQSLTPTKEAVFRIRRTSFDTAATDDPTFIWRSIYSRVSGELPVVDLPPFVVPTFVTRKKNQGVSFLRFHVDVTTAGEVKLLFNSTNGLTLWLDGQPTPVTEELQLELAQERHAFTLAVNLIERLLPLRVELVDVTGSPAQAQIVGGK